MNKSELQTEDSLQPVKYLGKVHSLYTHGINVAMDSVRIIWKRSKKGSHYNRCAISIHPFGLCLYEEIANGTYKNVWFDAVENISYCVAEPLHRRIFSWIARSQQSNELECHIILCKTSRQAQLFAELLARTFYESYRSRQQHRTELTPNISTHCSVCDTIARQQQQQTDHNSSLPEDHSHYQYNDDMEEKPRDEDYEHVSFQVPIIARAFVRNYDRNSMHNSSHRSIDYDTTLADEESIGPMEYYRRTIV